MSAFPAADLAVNTTSGPVHGILDRGVRNWRGVPYGRIEARFRPPVPAFSAEPIRADDWGPVSWQVPIYAGTSWSAVHPDAVEDEQCLNLNLWAPAAAGPPRPVLVWLHPGGHVYGCGSMPTVDAWVYAARHDAVVLTANYRLGPWGWLDLGALDAGFQGSANLPVLDQLLLLEWVRENIAAFGGDPGNVTLFGSSSGASDAATLLGVPAARPLFHRVAIYSGNAEDPVPAATAGDRAKRFLAAAGSLASSAGDLSTMANVGLRYVHRQLLHEGVVQYGPHVDGRLIPRLPLESIADGELPAVPALVSVTSDEGRMYEAFSADSVDHMYAGIDGAAPDVDHEEKIRALSREYFFAPAERLLNAVTGRGLGAWAQVFDYHPTTSSLAQFPAVADKAVHGVDLTALFTDPEGQVGTDRDRRIAAREQAALMGLARHGDPGWERWDPGRRPAEWISTDPAAAGRTFPE